MLLFAAESEAVFEYAAQLEEDVALVTCTVAVAFDATFPKAQVRVWLVIAHVPGPVYAGLMLQVIPVPEGSVSLKIADVAAPVPLLAAIRV